MSWCVDMKNFCIPKPIAERMKAGFKSGEMTVAGLYEMNSNQRKNAFEEYVSSELAQKINGAFEESMISKDQEALKKWAQSVFNSTEKNKPTYKTIVEKINELKEIGVLDGYGVDNYLNDLVAERLGVSVTAEEAKAITEKAEALEKEFNVQTEDGIPTVEYWVKRKEMDDYVDSLTPTDKLKVFTSVIGRGSMLFSIKSPLTNIISNTAHGLVQAIERRIANKSYRGLNGDFSLKYIKKVNDIYQKSGFDISRMETLNEGQRRRGEEITTTQGPGTFKSVNPLDWVRPVGRFYEDIVFKQLMGAPDVVSSAIAFSDSVDLASSELAKSKGLRGEEAKSYALELFKDAILIKPQTLEGEILRSQAIADAQYSTYTNKGGYSDLAMAIRSALNNVTGNIRLGDQLMPFVKTPANFVQAGIEASGLPALNRILNPFQWYKLLEAKKQLDAGNTGPMKDVVRIFIRGGLGFTLAAVLAHMFDPDDYIGEYDSILGKGKDMVRLKNATYNSIKIGNKYISLDYLGPIASPFVGMMYARKYGDTLPDKIFQYARGITTQAIKVPGLREFSDLVESLSKGASQKNLVKVGEELSDTAVSYLRARVVPAMVYDFAKGIDPVERSTYGDVMGKVKAAFPGSRQTLPERIDQTTGSTSPGEGLISSMLFGSRLKTANSSALISEIDRLYGVGEGPSIGNLEYTSGRVADLKEQIGNERFNEAIKYFGTIYGEASSKAIKDEYYKREPDENKAKILNRIRRKAVDQMLVRFNYKPKK